MEAQAGARALGLSSEGRCAVWPPICKWESAMTSAYNWESGEGLLGIDDPADWDAAFERGEQHLGTAVIGLAFNCSLEDASPRIVRAMQLPDAGQRGSRSPQRGTRPGSMGS